MAFGKSTIVVDGNTLPCTDRHGRVLSSNVQIVRAVVVPAYSEMTVKCRLTAKTHPPVGVMEGKCSGLMIAASLNQPSSGGHILVRSLNPTGCPMTVPAGTVVGTYHGVDRVDIDPVDGPHATVAQGKANSFPGRNPQPPVPEHLRDVFAGAVGSCGNAQEAQQLVALLSWHGSIFSTGDDDIGSTTLVEHSIPTPPGTKPIRQHPHRLGPEKEVEAE